MEMQPNERELIIKEADKSKLRYAVSIADSIIKSKDSDKIKDDLDRIWKICGYSSKKKFEELFKYHTGYSIHEYCKSFNPNCKC